LPPGPTAEFVNRLLPGLYLAVLSAALLRALISAHLFGGARRLIEQFLARRRTQRRPASSGSGFWAEMRERVFSGGIGDCDSR
jgi:hypothetical protein